MGTPCMGRSRPTLLGSPGTDELARKATSSRRHGPNLDRGGPGAALATNPRAHLQVRNQGQRLPPEKGTRVNLDEPPREGPPVESRVTPTGQ
jgi:hypothetical protein